MARGNQFFSQTCPTYITQPDEAGVVRGATQSPRAVIHGIIVNSCDALGDSQSLPSPSTIKIGKLGGACWEMGSHKLGEVSDKLPVVKLGTPRLDG